MGQRIDAPGRMVEEEKADPPGEKKGAEIIAQEPPYEEKGDRVRSHHAVGIIFMLELKQLVSAQIGDHFWIDRGCIAEHPKHMCMEEASFNCIGVSVRIDERMVEAAW